MKRRGFHFKFAPDLEPQIDTSQTRASHAVHHFSCTLRAAFTHGRQATLHDHLSSAIILLLQQCSISAQLHTSRPSTNVISLVHQDAREDRVTSDPVASPDAQGSLVARITGCWLVCTVASRASRVSVTPRVAGSHRAPESVSSSIPIDQGGIQSARKLDHMSELQVLAREHVQASRPIVQRGDLHLGRVGRALRHW